jgi:hypothetical protein
MHSVEPSRTELSICCRSSIICMVGFEFGTIWRNELDFGGFRRRNFFMIDSEVGTTGRIQRALEVGATVGRHAARMH